MGLSGPLILSSIASVSVLLAFDLIQGSTAHCEESGLCAKKGKTGTTRSESVCGCVRPLFMTQRSKAEQRMWWENAHEKRMEEGRNVELAGRRCIQQAGL